MTWDELKKHIRQGEYFVEESAEHVAILTARFLHAQRLEQSLEADLAATEAKAEALKPDTPIGDGQSAAGDPVPHGPTP